MNIPPLQHHISLTDQIEFVQVDDLFKAGINQFEMIRTPETETQINEKVSALNIFKEDYIAYIMTEIKSDRINILPVLFTDILKRNSTYFFLNKNINELRTRIEIRLLDIWRMRAGVSKVGNKCFSKKSIRFPYVMPSRGKIFR